MDAKEIRDIVHSHLAGEDIYTVIPIENEPGFPHDGKTLMELLEELDFLSELTGEDEQFLLRSLNYGEISLTRTVNDVPSGLSHYKKLEVRSVGGNRLVQYVEFDDPHLIEVSSYLRLIYRNTNFADVEIIKMLGSGSPVDISENI